MPATPTKTTTEDNSNGPNHPKEPPRTSTTTSNNEFNYRLRHWSASSSTVAKITMTNLRSSSHRGNPGGPHGEDTSVARTSLWQSAAIVNRLQTKARAAAELSGIQAGRAGQHSFKVHDGLAIIRQNTLLLNVSVVGKFQGPQKVLQPVLYSGQ